MDLFPAEGGAVGFSLHASAIAHNSNNFKMISYGKDNFVQKALDKRNSIVV
jgi:hypothetical protein